MFIDVHCVSSVCQRVIWMCNVFIYWSGLRPVPPIRGTLDDDKDNNNKHGKHMEGAAD